MKRIFTLLLSALSVNAMAQTTFTNGGFESWGGNTGHGVAAEPTGWYSNKSGSSTAAIGPQTCFQDNTIVHSGTSSVRVQNATVPIIGTVVNGNVTTGVINAPSTSKADGYIGTRNYTDSIGDIRRTNFTGRPDSLVGWYQYTSGGSAEQGRIRAILHVGHYFDPETPTTFHGPCLTNKIGEAQFSTPTSNISTWTRFSVPFTYAATTAPAYIMINVTSSADQNTTATGSKLWLDDLQVVYNTPATGISEVATGNDDVQVYSSGKTVYTNFTTGTGAIATLTVTDLTGWVIFSGKTSMDKQNTFDASMLNTGIYVYQLSNSSLCKTGKLFIQ